jgi:hypothetical protein
MQYIVTVMIRYIKKIILIEINGTKLDSVIWISFIRKMYLTSLYGHYYVNFEICGI